MKQLVILGSLIASSMVAGAAYAQPAEDTAPAKPEREMPPIYVGAGGELGGNLNLMTGLYGEAGIAVHRDMFLHARISHGDASDLSEAIGGSGGGEAFAHGNSRYTQVRAGLELHACTSRGTACLIYGADLGVLGTSPSQGPTSDTPSSKYLEESIVPRAGLDVGGTHVRARFAVETAVGATQRRDDYGMDNADHLGLQGTMVTGGLAYTF